MKRLMAVVGAALIGGCATPGELMKTGDRSEHVMERPPALAIACMQRNIESDYDVAHMVVRPLDGGGTELVMGTMLVAQAQAQANGGGSRVTIWLRPQWFVGKAMLVQRMVAGR